MTTKGLVSKGLLLLIAVALGWFRVYGYVSMPFPAVAHVFTGGMLGIWWTKSQDIYTRSESRFYLVVAIALSVLEVCCFVYFKTHT